MILETIIGALVPVGVEGIKQLIGRFNGGVRPTTIAEQIQLDNSEIARLEAANIAFGFLFGSRIMANLKK